MRTPALRYTAVLLALVPVVTAPLCALSSMPDGTAKPIVPDSEKAIRGFYASLAETIKKRDVEAFAKLLKASTTNDWTSTSPSKYILTRAEEIEYLQQHPKEVFVHLGGKDAAYSVIVTRVKIDGDKAVVDAVLRETNPTLDAALQSNTKAKPQHRAKLTPTHDTWVKKSGLWKLQRCEAIADRFEIDGKIVKP